MRARGWIGVLCVLIPSACGGEGAGVPAADNPAPDAGVGIADAASGAEAGPGADASTEAATSPACTGKTKDAGDSEVKVTTVDGERRFLLHVPRSYAPDRATPLVVAMHGYTEGPEMMRDVSHYSDVAEAKGFLVAYPEGRSQSWNAGVCCGTARFTNIDDVAFIRALVAAVSKDLCVDAKRIFASGFSNGGFLAHRLACEMSDVFAAIGVGSGQLGVPSCTPARPVAVIQVHGTSDAIVPYNGNALIQYAATKDTLAGWVSRNGCGATSTKTPVDEKTSCERWSTACKGGADVELCTIEGGGHEWFGGGAKWIGGVPPAGFVETTRFVEFFLAHPMQ